MCFHKEARIILKILVIATSTFNSQILGVYPRLIIINTFGMNPYHLTTTPDLREASGTHTIIVIWWTCYSFMHLTENGFMHDKTCQHACMLRPYSFPINSGIGSRLSSSQAQLSLPSLHLSLSPSQPKLSLWLSTFKFFHYLSFALQLVVILLSFVAIYIYL